MSLRILLAFVNVVVITACGAEGLPAPLDCGVAPPLFDIRGDVLLVPDLEARVTLLDKSNKLIVHLGDGGNGALRGEPREKFIPGKFICPHSAAFDKDGNIFVVEWVEVGRVTKLKKV